ncbi:putative PTS system, cellobiose-specific IIC component [Amygdalobacter nucleatus]|uniref:Permease IIC component n=2 Tax=Amygdalobacter nucleatus TaxID=3029274 RepID=A0A133YGX9_9FIRM|nr:putative PTS system, cellobiose-specific IIC component [Amygdalobacter nucleatus]
MNAAFGLEQGIYCVDGGFLRMNLKNFMEEKLAPVAYKLATNKILLAVRNGLAMSMPLIMAGSLLMIIASFPIQAWKDLLKDAGIVGYLWKGVDSSFGLVSLIAAFGVAMEYAKMHDIDGLSAGIISVGSFITLTPFVKGEAGAGVPTQFLGASGLFVALVVALVSSRVYIWFIKRNIQITLPETVPPAVARSFSGIIPGIVIISGWLAIFATLDAFGLPNMHILIQQILSKPVRLFTNNLLGTCVVAGLNGLFWFVGVHGADTVHTFFGPTWLENINANMEAVKAGLPLPHIVTNPFMMNFVYIGGGGATLGLVIVLAILARRKNASKQAKALAPITFTPGIFNINEPTIFGVPVVLNFKLLIPFVFTPIVNAIITYTTMAIGIVPRTCAMPTWTMPPILSGFFATGSIMGSILQIVLIVIDILIYAPFVMELEKDYKKLEEAGEKE